MATSGNQVRGLVNAIDYDKKQPITDVSTPE